MRIFLILLGKELRSIFLSPVAYVVLGLVMVLNGLAFNASLSILQSSAESSSGGSAGSLVTWTFNSTWFYMSYFAIFPLITMRLFAEERRLGTLETLLTAPVRTGQFVLSKFAAATVFYVVLWLPSLLNFIVFQWVTAGAAELPGGALTGAYTIIFVMGLFNIAMGCFASALTSNQLIAAITTLTLCVLHFLLGLFTISYKQILAATSDAVINYIATVEHLRTFTEGLIDTRAIVYYTSFAVFFLFLTHQVIEYRRWKV